MKTIANFGLMDVISEDNKDTINFNHSSGQVTFVLDFKGQEITIERAYWRHPVSYTHLTLPTNREV